jgi:hypothetical protein
MTDLSPGRVGIELTWGQFGLGVAPVVSFPAPESDRTKAARETGQAVLLMKKASPAQLALLTHLAQTAADNRYFSPDARWIEMILKSVKELSEGEVKQLYDFDWTPRKDTQKELKNKIADVLKKPA